MTINRLESKEERIAREKQSVLDVVKSVMSDPLGSAEGKDKVNDWATRRFDELEAELHNPEVK